MTDMGMLAERLKHRVEWQAVPEDMYTEDLTVFIADAIRYLYVITGRGLRFREDWFVRDETTAAYTAFEPELP